VDYRAHLELGIPHEERIIMLVAVGYSNEAAVVPLSYRKNISNVLEKC
jgi:nitroreductase